MFDSQVEVREGFGLGIFFTDFTHMMRFSLLIFVFAIVSLVSKAQGSLGVLENKQGFRDAKMGMPFSAFKGMKFVRPNDFEVSLGNDFLKKYERIYDSKKLGNIPLKHIYYNFYKGNLYSVVVITDGKYENDVLVTLHDAYGVSQDTQFSGSNKSYYWITKTIELSLHKIEAEVLVAFLNVTLHDAVEKERAKRKEKAKFNQIDGL